MPKLLNKLPAIPTALATGAFLLYAIQSHLITDFFILSMSLFFDKFSVKACGIFPDIALLIFFALATIGTFSVLKNHLSATLTSAVMLAVFAVYGS